MSVLCTICARGGSKELPNKALSVINNKPLIAYTIEQALDSKIFDHVIVSTDSETIAQKAKDFGAEVWFIRPKELATDFVGKVSVVRHATQEAEKYYKTKFDIIVDLDITSPLRSVNDIQKALKHFIDTKASNLITACPSRKSPYFNMVEISNERVQIVKKLSKDIIRRQDSPKTYDMNASIYIWNRETILSSNSLFTSKTSLYVMSAKQSIDIDSQHDLDIVKFLINKKNND